jgi:hypothetical protein
MEVDLVEDTEGDSEADSVEETAAVGAVEDMEVEATAGDSGVEAGEVMGEEKVEVVEEARVVEEMGEEARVVG